MLQSSRFEFQCKYWKENYNKKNVVTKNPKILKILPFLPKIYNSMTENPETLNKSKKNVSEGKRPFQDVLLKKT